MKRRQEDGGLLEQVGAFTPVPGEELLRRINGLKHRMEAAEIDFAVIFQNVDRFYFTGSMQKGLTVIAPDHEPMIFIEKSTERASRECPFPITIIGSEKEIKDILHQKGLLKGVAGLELDVLPVATFERLKRVLGLTRHRDVAPLVKELRAVKSPYELEQLRKSGEILSKVLKKAGRIIKEGVREIDIDAELTAEGRKLGHQGFLRMRGINQEMMTITVTSGITSVLSSCADVPIAGTGVTPALPQGSSLKRVERGMPVLVDYGGAYNGYITDETRVFVVGTMEEVFRKPYETAREIIDDAMSHARTGVDCTDVYARALRKAKAAGLEDSFMGHGQGQVSFIGHGLGLEINELPVLTARHSRVLEEGMVFAFEPKFVLPGQGAIGVEVDLIVRDSGLERLTHDSTDIVYV
jgi:Xaa-Pro dipeptidase